MLKSTMQDLADAVGVSRITVWKALNDREGVSPRTKKRIQQKAAEMGLTDTEIQMEKTPEKETGRDEAEERTFSVVVSRPESSAFWMQIIHHIAKELARSRINLMYTYMPSFYSEGYTLPASVKNVDGLTVLNIYDARLLHMLNELPLPKVFLDTVPGMHPPALHGDLVLIEGRTCIREITLAGLRWRYWVRPDQSGPLRGICGRAAGKESSAGRFALPDGSVEPARPL